MVTPNNEYLMLVVGESQSEIWNLATKEREYTLAIKVEKQMITCSPIVSEGERHL